MPYTTELTQDCVGIVHSGSGLVTGDELVAATTAATLLVQNTENFQYEFSDFTDVTDLQVAPEALERIIAQDHIAAKSRPRAIIVLVVPGAQAHQLAVQWEERVRDLGWTIHIARERSEALKWLAHHLKSERPELLAQIKQNAA